MSGELEAWLLALGAALDVPAPPDVVPAALARLPARPRRHPPSAGRLIAAVVATVLLLAGAAMAIPTTRDAILRVLGLRGVRIERVRHLPPLPPGAGASLDLGQRIPLSRVRHAASFTALLPPGPSAAYIDDDIPGGRISLPVRRALIIEFRGSTTPFIFKVIGPGTTVTQLRVNGGRGVYLSGAPHLVIFREVTGEIQTDRVRLAGNVLLWQQGPLTVRIEGTRTLRQALALARSMR
jgi:hypothetical protein